MNIAKIRAPAPQTEASDPRACAFVAANAGSGKTFTLVSRVARLLLAGARPEAILCVTFTKAAAAEMQARLFETLGAWAVMDDDALGQALARIDEPGRDRSKARALFARALETPGGLKIQTIHAFCEQLLRRFPLEAGVSPAFKVLDDAAAADISRTARDGMAALALADAEGPAGLAYAHVSVALAYEDFRKMLAMFEARRAAITAYVTTHGGACAGDVWRRFGFDGVTSCEDLEAAAVSRIRWGAWRRAAEALAQGTGKTDQELAAKMRALEPGCAFDAVWPLFLKRDGAPRERLGTKSVDPEIRAWLQAEQTRHYNTAESLRAARMARDTVHVLVLGHAYGSFYDQEKARRGALDFGDLVALTIRLLTEKADAAWVLYKLDGGIDHLLLDEAQDTAPEQWDILRVLTEEFFSGAGAAPRPRTVFAVGDEKQSIFSFQGAAPERLSVETQAFARLARDASALFRDVKLLESWRSAPEILKAVDAVFASGPALAGVRPAQGDSVQRFPLTHIPRRPDHGRVDLWPLEQAQPGEPPDPWAPVDAELATSAGKLLARRIAEEISHMLARGHAVVDRKTGAPRPCVPGDMLILVRRRRTLFHEIIRALKRAGIPVGGPDRLELSTHGVFQDLMALARFALFPADDLTLAGLMRGPFCELDEAGLFDLAHGRSGSLWEALTRRADERASWRAAADFLDWARLLLPQCQPFDGFSRVLARLDNDGRSMRQRLLTRLGAEGEDALEAFLSLVLESEGQGVRDLESLAARLARTQQEIKRDPDAAEGAGGGAVRVMTTHGAKGLEAPIVILPDTSTRATSQGSPLLDLPEGGFAWAPRAPDDCPASALARQRRDEAVAQESARLLYVALTRARDWLIIAGVESRPHLFEGSWRDWIEVGFARLEARPTPLIGGGMALRFGDDPASLGAAAPAITARTAPPAWIGALAPFEGPPPRRAAPSALSGSDEGDAPSPLDGGGPGRYRRGALIHGLLERLPDLAPGARAGAALTWLGRERDLDDHQRAEIAAAALGLLEDPQFAPVFGPGSRAEVAIAGGAAGLPAGLSLSGRIDRLVVEADRVLIVDFKTNRPAPARIEDADPAYILQMAAYAAILGEVYPTRRIAAALVWTDGPRLMAVPDNVMRQALDDLA
jgi:ATP-dependent helicase/nuclease subunit A